MGGFLGSLHELSFQLPAGSPATGAFEIALELTELSLVCRGSLRTTYSIDSTKGQPSRASSSLAPPFLSNEWPLDHYVYIIGGSELSFLPMLSKKEVFSNRRQGKS